jgi:hypothetical protein
VDIWSWLNSLKIETKMASLKDYFSKINAPDISYGLFSTEAASIKSYNLFSFNNSKESIDLYAVDRSLSEEELLFLQLSNPDRNFISKTDMIAKLESILNGHT